MKLKIRKYTFSLKSILRKKNLRFTKNQDLFFYFPQQNSQMFLKLKAFLPVNF